ncbi:MAG: NifB/NifX family molybdenum-iron cluster-binding protein [Desulfurella sp.]|jgi:predicted Fe-Mo cluster-binding NifX family protein
MKVMIPLIGEVLSEHFGRAQRFVIYEIENGVVKDKKFYDSIEHQEGAFPAWAKSQNVDLVILCGVGPRAIEFFNSYGIDVISGVAPQEHSKIVQDYLDGTLIYTNKSVCEH